MCSWLWEACGFDPAEQKHENCPGMDRVIKETELLGFGLGANKVGTYSKRALCTLTICCVLDRSLQLFALDKEARLRLEEGIAFLSRKDGAWTLRRANKITEGKKWAATTNTLTILWRDVKLIIMGRVCWLQQCGVLSLWERKHWARDPSPPLAQSTMTLDSKETTRKATYIWNPAGNVHLRPSFKFESN